MPKHWVAFSGGLDSHVLLHFLATNFSQLKLEAIHINHQLLPQANAWEKHCQKVCRDLQIPLQTLRVRVPSKAGENLEAAARAVRYQAFIKLMQKNDILLTAHHLDDQAETVLLQLLRGAGLRGVSAMAPTSVFYDGFLMRPLLDMSRDDLTAYAICHGLNWIEDPSNADQRFDRNFIRHAVSPLLKQRWPHFQTTLARFAKHCAEQEQLLQLLAASDYEHCRGEHLNTLYIPTLKKLDKHRQFNVLRLYFTKLNLHAPSETLLNELRRNIIQAKTDANPVVTYKNMNFRRYRNHVYFLSNAHSRQPQLTAAEQEWCRINLPHALQDRNISIRYRKGGERFRPSGHKLSRTLKNLFQEWGVPPWLRDEIPLIYKHEQLIAIVGFKAAL